MIGAVVLRPEPGNAATAARLAAAGVIARRCPLFAIRPLAWEVPDPTMYDALLLTSANAARHAGPGLTRLSHLPILAVGAATARAAEAAGLAVMITGETHAADLVATAQKRGWRRLLHLAGQHHTALDGVDVSAVYASDALPIEAATAAGWAGHVALLHSARAARRFAELINAHGDRAVVAVAALSDAVANAAGEGWAARKVASAPTDAALVAVARALIDRHGPAADNGA